MVYNKTKRGMELAACIVNIIYAVVITCLATLFFISDLMHYVWISTGLIVAALSILVSIPWLIFSIICLKNPVNKDGTLKKRKAYRIINIVISFIVSVLGIVVFSILLNNSLKFPYPAESDILLSALFIVLFIIDLAAAVIYTVAYNLKDRFTEEEWRERLKRKQEASGDYIQLETQYNLNQANNSNISNKILELKHYKDLGILSEEEYNAKVNEMLNNF